MIVVIDNYDSFTFNLVQQIERLAGESVEVVRNDAFDPVELLASEPKAIVISPGPGTPERAGRIVELIERDRSVALLGICLGHQAIGAAYGAKVVRGKVPVHGKTDQVYHRGDGLFAGCPVPMTAARYHSLIIEPRSLEEGFRIDAETEDGTIMAIAHRRRPIFGIQFHPESYGTVGGDQLILNFLKVANRRRRRKAGEAGESSSKAHPMSSRAKRGIPSDDTSSAAATGSLALLGMTIGTVRSSPGGSR
jgi:anthranilate synthase/aminodeoxychorismate synthase-like glutamine amidotransferase